MEPVVDKDGNFKFWYPAQIQKGSDGKRWVQGIASTEDKDLQGEVVKQDGLDLSYYLTRGFLNWDHGKDASAKIGIPVEAKVTKNGLFTRGYLLDTRQGQDVYDLAVALEKAGNERRLGFSVEGRVLERDRDNPRIITKAWIRDIAVTAAPINPKTYCDIAKSIISNVAGPESWISAANEEEAIKAFDERNKKEEIDEPTKQLEVMAASTKTPVKLQSQEEEKDALRNANRALEIKNGKEKPELEKEMRDVPVARRAGKSLAAAKIVDDDDNSAKSLCLEIGDEAQEIVPDFHDEEDQEPGKDEQASQEAIVEHTAHKTRKTPAQKEAEEKARENYKSFNNFDLEKGEFKRDAEEKWYTDRPDGRKSHTATHYRHPSGIHVAVYEFEPTEGAEIIHLVPGENGKEKALGRFNFDENDDASEHLSAFGIKHKFHSKEKKSDTETNLSKGFGLVHSYSGDYHFKHGDMKPVSMHVYRNPNGHQISVTSSGGAHVVSHTFHPKRGQFEQVGLHAFADKDRDKNDDALKQHLAGFGISHHFTANKVKKSLIQCGFEHEHCIICKNHINNGDLCLVANGETFCSDECIEKALVVGYNFHVTDQAGGNAMRVESLEGSKKDLSYGGVVGSTKVKTVSLGTLKANGGQTQITLKDAFDYLLKRGLPENLADRVLILLIRDQGKALTKLANAANRR